MSLGVPGFYLQIGPKREPTSGLEPLTCSLRVIGHVLQGVAGDCKCRIFGGVSFPYLAECCTVLRSRRYHSGVTNTLSSTFDFVQPTQSTGYRTTQSTSPPLTLAFSYASLRINELPLCLLLKCCKIFAQALSNICRPVMHS
jgi:hypothetical protein